MMARGTLVVGYLDWILWGEKGRRGGREEGRREEGGKE